MATRPDPIETAEFIQLVADALINLTSGEELVLYSYIGRYTVTRGPGGFELYTAIGRTGHLHYRHITEVTLCNDLTITFGSGPHTDPITDMEVITA